LRAEMFASANKNVKNFIPNLLNDKLQIFIMQLQILIFII